MNLEPALYPRREIYTVSECGMKPLRDLERWVKGASFHSYGVASYAPREGEAWADSLERMKDCPGELTIEGKLLDYRSQIEYWVWYRRGGDSDAHGGSGPHSSPEDAAYSCLVYIEEHERSVYEEQLVVGLA